MSLQKAVEQLKPQFRGQILTPSDEGYEVARKVYNAMIDKRPGAIARCVNVADVMAAVRAAREQGVLAAIRGGGHNGGGLGICDDGLVIDLSLMRGVRVDPAARTVRAAGWLHRRRRGSRHARLWDGHADGNDFYDRHRGADAGRWDRPFEPPLRPDHR